MSCLDDWRVLNELVILPNLINISMHRKIICRIKMTKLVISQLSKEKIPLLVCNIFTRYSNSHKNVYARKMIVGVLKSWARQKGKWGLHHSTASMLCHHPAPWWLSLNSKPKRKDSIWAICNQENKSSCVTPKAEHITPPSFPSKPNFPEKHKKSQPISWISNPENFEKV